jgi:hypothetical protein
MKIDDSTQIISVKFIDVDTKKEKELVERPGSRCHFNEVLCFGNYFIQLRLDWGDTKNGDPLLDADIWTETHGRKKFLRKKGTEWHHIEKKPDPESGLTMYTFKFKNLVLRLMTRRTLGKGLSLDAVLDAKFEEEVDKNF